MNTVPIPETELETFKKLSVLVSSRLIQFIDSRDRVLASLQKQIKNIEKGKEVDVEVLQKLVDDLLSTKTGKK